MARIYHVDIDLDDIDETDLVGELIRRGYSVAKMQRKPDSFEEVIELFKAKNPKVPLVDTLELENHMKQILSRA